jgi:ribosome-associated protein
MDIRKLQRAIVDGLEDVKGQNIVVFNTEHLTPLFERVIIASGTSNRQTKSLASSVRDSVKSSGFPVLRTEGESNGEWIIVDCGAAVVHVMQPSIRDYYHLEEIWGDKPVNMKLNSGAVKLVKASEPEKPIRSKPVARKAPAKAAPAKTVSRAKPQARKAPAPVGKAVVTRIVGVKRPAAKAPAAKKAVAAKRAPIKAAPVRKPAVKKPPARKTSSRA